MKDEIFKLIEKIPPTFLAEVKEKLTYYELNTSYQNLENGKTIIFNENAISTSTKRGLEWNRIKFLRNREAFVLCDSDFDGEVLWEVAFNDNALIVLKSGEQDFFESMILYRKSKIKDGDVEGYIKQKYLSKE